MKKLFLTSMLVFGVIPAFAEPSHTQNTFPVDRLMQADYAYVGQANSDNMVGVYQNGATVYANALYEDTQYTIDPGYYLPGSSETQTQCNQDGYFCPDNMTSDEGSADVSDCSADIHCNAGYYLPANSLVCERCQNNYYCPGGDLTPADADVGINECPAGLVAPAGTADIGNCGKVMRIGNNVLYLTQTRQTTPALAARIDGVVYYARTTPVSNGLRHINENTTDYLRTNIDGTEYSIHDNTVVFDE